MNDNTPENTIVIRTYPQLRHHIRAFADGKYPFVILVGRPGLGKTRAIRQALAGQPHVLMDNHATAFGLYESAYNNADTPLVLDDLDHLYRDNPCIRLLKALCSTEPVKTMRWMTNHPKVGNKPNQIPPEFTTSSPVCLLANHWKTTDDNVLAVEDRAVCFQFLPSAKEVHREVGRWYQNLTVYEFLGRHLGLIPRHSMRHYVRGAQLYVANPDEWKYLLLESMGVDGRTRKIIELADTDSYKTEEERAVEFEAAGLGSRAT